MPVQQFESVLKDEQATLALASRVALLVSGGQTLFLQGELGESMDRPNAFVVRLVFWLKIF